MAEKKYLDYEGLQELVLKIKEFVGDAGKLEFKGTVIDVAHLPSVAAQKIGYMYTVQAAGETTADFTDGAGKTVAANSEVAAVEVESTSEKSVWSVDAGVSYVSADLQAYEPTGTLSAATKLASAYVADGTETHLVNGTLYVTEDGASFFSVTALADTFADFTKEAIDNEDQIAELGALYTGDSFKDLNLYTETVEGKVMKWCLLGPVFDVSNKLTFGFEMPSNPAQDNVFLFLGDTTYAYNEVTPEVGDDPAALGWYHSDDSGATWELATEHEADTTTYIYATKDEEFVQGVIYKYDETDGWEALNSGDTMVAITTSEVDALFE